MAIVYATKSGNWSDTTVWNTSALPTTVDEVYSNNFAVTVNIDPEVLLLSNRATSGVNAGGYFSFTGTRALTANVQGGPTSTTLDFSGTLLTIKGNISGGNSSTTDGLRAIVHNSSGTITVCGAVCGGYNGRSQYAITALQNGTTNIYGIVFGQQANNGAAIRIDGAHTVNIFGNCYSYGDEIIQFGSSNATVNILGDVYGPTLQGSGIAINNTNVLNITGNVIASTGSSTAAILFNVGSSTVNIFGNLSGGSVSSARCINDANSSGFSKINIYGNLYGGDGQFSDALWNQYNANTYIKGDVYGRYGRGIVSGAGGTIVIDGTIYAGSLESGVANGSTAVLSAKRVVGSGFGQGSVGLNAVYAVSNSQNGKFYVREIVWGSRGMSPISGPVYIDPNVNNTITTTSSSIGPYTTFFNSLSVSNLLPPASSVSAGVVYNAGSSTGTMIIPPASATVAGVPVGNTVGTAALTPNSVWVHALSSITDSNSIGGRLKNAATIQSVGQQIAAFNT